MVTKNNKKTESILYLLIGLVGIVLLNLLAYRLIWRIDLTEEKRYTIQPATRQMLSDLPGKVYVEVYLEGDFNPEFKRLQKSIRETLEQFRIYGGSNIQFRFQSPDEAESAKARNQFYYKLANMGIQPTTVFDNKDGQKIEKLIFPGAMVSYQGQEVGVLLLKGNRAAGSSAVLNQSIEGIEYELANAIRKITQPEKRRIALIQEHGELDSLETAGMMNSLLENYQVLKVNLSQKAVLEGYDAVIIAKPRIAFNEREKYLLDQYLMKGGKLLFFIDQLSVNMDEAAADVTLALPVEHNLDDLLFKYGVRINQDLVQDIQCGNFPVVVGNMGDQPQITMLPWPYFPLTAQYGKHPIVRNLDATLVRFGASIDSVKALGVIKTPLMFSSPYTKLSTSPVSVSLNDLRGGLNPQLFTKGAIPMVYLLEGNFVSAFKNRVVPEGFDKSKHIEIAQNGKVLVCSDGDLIRNELDNKTGQPLPLGFDQFSRKTYANNDFLLNAINYMTDENGIIAARSKEVKIRPLDKIRVQAEKLKWQIINIAAPLVLLIVFGILRAWWRKRKYSTN